ncbi:hypothetical protein [Nostoc sp. 106C]|uniref:hypothetical protein n=1 Tax=Nostoc sp. 106C TaxID=1932667 RepID=UPI000A3D3E65|nr:hypothetical protein [Nostoc sp. 106C]OUL20363.1 hypothetical protein BV375_30905 [Nostoc sp. 106C]
MSIYDNNIQAFIEVIELQPDVISTDDWAELQQISSNLSADKEEIAEFIENWLQPESRSQILQAYRQQLKLISSSHPIDLNINLGIGGSKSPTPPNQPSPSSKELIENTIKKNSPLSDKQQSQQQP